ncbi:pentatricopeptide repeat-containing protein At2g29760, chloroplastic-like [Rosa rugosa]|uniref:pentatricopeptide repeat-containing protein At2g29760, chloroplastic-like n=1 Tax=Rosa rugosa TaxID=74645 RepID=UPI002B413E44|nr:pentatricopeptide repeat-containing protein At2g29760, chloroplastic-like [Rosa rugosa]
MNHVYKFHAWLIKTGQQNHPPSLRRILLWCAATPSPKSLSYFRALFAYIPSPDTFAYNTIIRAHVADSSPSHAVSFFTQCVSEVFYPITSPSHFFSRLVLTSNWVKMLDVHALILKLGFHSDIYVQNALVSFYGGCGSVELALNVFHAMHQKDLLAKNVMPDEVTMLSAISAVSSLGALELGQWVHDFINKSRLKLTVSLGTALIDMYSRCGSVDKSTEIFDEMSLKNVQTWTALSTGLAVHGCSRED